MTTFEQTLTVTKEHLDELQHVNNVQYLQWVQEIAGAHWQELIKDNPTEFGLWVVRSHHIEYKHQAKLGDRLKIVTHVALTEGFQSERRVRFFLADSDRLIAQCSTHWCYLDPQTHKLLRIPEEVYAVFA